MMFLLIPGFHARAGSRMRRGVGVSAAPVCRVFAALSFVRLQTKAADFAAGGARRGGCRLSEMAGRLRPTHLRLVAAGRCGGEGRGRAFPAGRAGEQEEPTLTSRLFAEWSIAGSNR